MAATTTLLGLVTPTQGTLSGTWGDTVNYGISDYVDIAIAGTLSFAGDGAITLANTTGSSSGNAITTTTAQYMVIRITGTQTVTKVITGPSYSKLYMVDHAGATSAVTFKASGQTGVSIAVGEKAFVYYNGTDYVKVASSTALTGTVAIASGGTGQITASAAFNALSPVTTTGDLIIGNGTNSATRLAIGANNYVLTSNGTTATWAASTGGVTSFSAGTTGFTPSTGTTGAITLAGTLGVANGGTGLTSTPTNGQIDIGNGTNFTRATITAGTGISVTNASGSITIAASGGSGGTGSNLYLAVNFGGF